ncbi:cupin domain-containing protein [Subtercola endophyticus]|uniref:cupin domain-containing protein n=1 Tax=Subtercola endophyticus TaxID=2895559 RepID=UPI001E44B0DA|nr:cupin domain-containing protein [Subtercola endophyticus]UFS60595.1 cupin domain-containing protein [Subtercola endophyticus]
MPLATLNDAPEFHLGNLRIRSLAVPSRGSVELSTWFVDLPPNSSSGAHSLSHEQIVVVGSGQVWGTVGDKTVVAAAGDAIILTPGVLIELGNDSDAPAQAIVISPVGFTATAGGHTFSPPWSL